MFKGFQILNLTAEKYIFFQSTNTIFQMFAAKSQMIPI